MAVAVSRNRAVLESVAAEMGASLSADFQAEVSESYDRLPGAEITAITLSDDILAQMNAALATVRDNWVEQMNSRGLAGGEIMDVFTSNLTE